MLDGAAGFEPASPGAKTPCLTAWLYPNRKSRPQVGGRLSSAPRPYPDSRMGLERAGKGCGNRNPQWSWQQGLNPRQPEYRTGTLPSELCQQSRGFEINEVLSIRLSVIDINKLRVCSDGKGRRGPVVELLVDNCVVLNRAALPLKLRVSVG